jgi:molybdenum cofactor biosynthesis enzyme MoaA
MKLKPLHINNARIIITDDCPYSCRYCGVYYAKALKRGLISDFDCSEIAGNEGSSVVIGRGKEKYLTPEDYTFLVKILKDNFGTNDITITGGDPFMRRDITEIINNITDLGIYVTTLTKGMPLFNKDIKSILGNCSRIIFSLDTLDADKYADLNLSLSNNGFSSNK